MTAFGKSIRIYLADGSPTGIRHAELVNWTGQAIVCPRGRVGELSAWVESQRPGVYMLVGEGASPTTPLIYIGEAENVFVRLQNHVKNKDFWTQVVFFTSKDENLTKAHVKYLEARLIETAAAAGRAQMENGTAPTLPALPRPDRDAMEDFLQPLRILLGTLGFAVLQSVSAKGGSKASDQKPSVLADIRLRLARPKLKVLAEGSATDEGFVVFQGSVGTQAAKSHLSPGYSALRDQLYADGSLTKRDDGTTLFAKDVLLASPSTAAAILVGGAINGRESWRDGDNRMLKDIEEALAGASEPTLPK
ncbi:MAG: GIY-YIG nuclease family protein [Myxococcales bacterium]|nr:GIY-YIG nuclease family protein [Myxococcales bacterium]